MKYLLGLIMNVEGLRIALLKSCVDNIVDRDERLIWGRRFNSTDMILSRYLSDLAEYVDKRIIENRIIRNRDIKRSSGGPISK